MRTTLLISIALGILCGLISTYPFELGPIASFALWAIAGLALGYWVDNNATAVRAGVVFGVSLSIVFLFSRFGGTADKLPAYSIIVAGSSIVGAVAGIVVVFIGSRLKMIFGS